MAYTVIIPSKNVDNLRVCLSRFDANTIVVWDGVDDFPPVNSNVLVRGPKPFNFARNVNLGIQLCNHDVIILNDDALLETPNGFRHMAALAEEFPRIGLIVPQIKGVTSCEEQRFAPERKSLIRQIQNHMVPFMCVYIPRRIIQAVGLLDEDELFDEKGEPIYTGEDDLYCARVRKAGYKLGIADGVVVEHGSLPSSFRTNNDGSVREIPCGPSRELYLRKFGRFPA